MHLKTIGKFWTVVYLQLFVHSTRTWNSSIDLTMIIFNASFLIEKYVCLYYIIYVANNVSSLPTEAIMDQVAAGHITHSLPFPFLLWHYILRGMKAPKTFKYCLLLQLVSGFPSSGINKDGSDYILPLIMIHCHRVNPVKITSGWWTVFKWGNIR